jgi:hypothetical protein
MSPAGARDRTRALPAIRALKAVQNVQRLSRLSYPGRGIVRTILDNFFITLLFLSGNNYRIDQKGNQNLYLKRTLFLMLPTAWLLRLL